MSHWRRLSRKHRALYFTLAVLALTATALASGRLAPTRSTAKSSEPVRLGGRLPPPSDVLIRKTSEFPELGNVLVMVKLTPAQVAAKQEEGTESYVTLGEFGELLFRDDGKSGDEVAGDALYTAVGQVDLSELAERAERELNIVNAGNDEAPVFKDRIFVGNQPQVPFDFDSFQAGQTVHLNTAVVAVSPITSHPHSSTQFRDRVLMIRNLSVVADPTRTIDPCNTQVGGTPGGVWTFKHLMTEMANYPVTNIDPAVFTENWLKNWTINQTINSLGVPSRSQMQDIIDSWRTASGGGNVNLNLDLAPFRLMAIVPRLDARSPNLAVARSYPGGGGFGSGFIDAGEVRFVFGLVLPAGWTLSGVTPASLPLLNSNGCRALPFSVIFEYRIPGGECEHLRGWAQRWSALNNLVPGTSSYNNALEQLTEEFVTADANPPGPNGSAIGQIRTNETALAVPWQLREFRLNDLLSSSQLEETMTAETWGDSYNNSSVFQTWLGDISQLLVGPPWDQWDPLMQSSYQFPGVALVLGSHPEMPSAGFFWTAPGLNLSPNSGDNGDNWARHQASLNSCNGCHARETSTNFVHIDPSTPAGLPASLSGFLTGIVVADPAEANGLPLRTFNDLVRREADIQALAGSSCFQIPPVDVSLVQDALARNRQIPENPFSPTLSPSQFISVTVDDLKANHIHEAH